MNLLLLIALLQSPTLRVYTDTLEAANVLEGRPRRAGTYVRAVARRGDQFIITASFESSRGGISYDTLAVEARTLKPLWQRIHFRTDSASVRYEGNRVTGFSHQSGRSRIAINRVLPADVQPTALIWHLVQTQDWRDVYVVREFDLWSDTLRTITYRALRKETIKSRGKPLQVRVVMEDRGPNDLMNGSRMVRLSWFDVARKRLVMRRDRPSSAGRHDGYLLIAR